MTRHRWARRAAATALMAGLASATVISPADAVSAEPIAATAVDVSTTIVKRQLAFHPVDLAEGATATVSLNWASRADLDLAVIAPDGTIAGASGTYTPGIERPWRPHTERVVFTARMAGTYRLRVFSRWGDASYRLVASVDGPTGPSDVSVGRWWIENEETVHTHTLAEAVAVARTHDFVSAVPWAYRGFADEMRAINPDLVLTTYMNATLAFRTEGSIFPASWYLRDPNGNKITNDWGLWLMDPANPDWRANRVAKCVQNIRAEHSDGCYLDNLGHGTIYPKSLSGRAVNPRTGALYTDAQWLRDTDDLIKQMRSSVPAGTILFGNGLMNGQIYFRTDGTSSKMLLDALDFGASETFVRIAAEPVGVFRPEEAWRADVDMIVDANSDGKRISAVTKVWSPASAADLDRIHEYSLATFLLADDGSNFFNFSTGMDMLPGERHNVRTLVRMGSPAGAYAKLPSGLYDREFTGGRVLVNPTDRAISIDLGGSYRSIDGASLSGVVTLGANTARVLIG